MINTKKQIRLYDDRNKNDTYFVDKILYENDDVVLVEASTNVFSDIEESEIVLFEKESGTVLTHNLEFYYAENYYGLKNIAWGSEESRLNYEARTKEVEEEGNWIRAYDHPPEEGQKVLYTFPGMNSKEYIGEYKIYRHQKWPDGTVEESGQEIGTFVSEDGFLGDEDVYWRPWPPEEEEEI